MVLRRCENRVIPLEHPQECSLRLLCGAAPELRQNEGRCPDESRYRFEELPMTPGSKMIDKDRRVKNDNCYLPCAAKRSRPRYLVISFLNLLSATISLSATWTASVRVFTPRTDFASSAKSVSSLIDFILALTSPRPPLRETLLVYTSYMNCIHGSKAHLQREPYRHEPEKAPGAGASFCGPRCPGGR